MPLASALEPDVTVPTRAAPRATDELSAPFFVCFTSLAEGTTDELNTPFFVCFTALAEGISVSEGHFAPVFSRGTMIFSGSTFFFLGAFAHLPDLLPAASTFLFFEGSV
jgi:hypothetical protein